MKQSTLVAAAAAAAPDVAWRRLHRAACAPYRAAGRFAWYFARGKLAHDPVFRAAVEQGWLQAGPRVLDIGCGQGLLASLLQHLRAPPGLAHTGQREWPHDAPAPATLHYTGIELMLRDVQRAQRALGTAGGTFVHGDMRSTPFPACDLAVILDVLHYVEHGAQAQVLRRVHQALAPRGRLLLRVGDAAARQRFRVSQWVDRAATRVRGHRCAPTWVRPLAEWVELVQATGFEVASVPMSRGTPFANVLLVAQRR